jgi:VCBS repeat protein/PASTA domain-containing protein/FG-GAP repeat protein
VGAFGAPGCAVLLACLGVALIFGVLAPSAAQAASFAARAPSFAYPASGYPTGRDPRSVAIGDLNGDRKPDLVTANDEANTVSVLLNRGDASFRAKRDYPTGHFPVAVAIGDLNGGGKLDLVTANEEANTISVLLNRGDGSFGVRGNYATGGSPRSVAIGDLNGDGRPDLAIANFGGEVPSTIGTTLSVLLNRGDGSFQPRVDYPTGKGPLSVAIGDLNGDGRPDLAIANFGGGVPSTFGNTVSVLLNTGDGSFEAKRDYRTGISPDSVAIGDLNGDGKPDLAIANGQGATVSVLANRGDGSFQARRDYQTGSDSDSVAIGDLNGDGKPDLATASAGESTISVLANRGDGSFQAARHFPTGGADSPVAIGDLNGDGKPDLATTEGAPVEAAPDGGVWVLLNATGLCVVPNLRGKTLPAAKRMLARAQCRVGKISRAFSKVVKNGRVISEKPRWGAVLPNRGRVNLVVSRGRNR